jgi:hypothetical protein
MCPIKPRFTPQAPKATPTTPPCKLPDGGLVTSKFVRFIGNQIARPKTAPNRTVALQRTLIGENQASGFRQNYFHDPKKGIESNFSFFLVNFNKLITKSLNKLKIIFLVIKTLKWKIHI